MKFFNELKRRNVVKETLAYLVVAWVLLQVAAIMLPVFDAPDWVLKTIAFTLILGIPLWFFFSWTYQVTPEGFKNTDQFSDVKVYSDKTFKRIDILIIFMVIIAVVISIYDRPVLGRLFPPSSQVITSVDISTKNSIAVLPFVNMSGDEEQEYFAEGLSEELINMFTQLPGLKVIGRTSSFSFKGKNEDLRTICEKLGVNYVLEGSVRKSGDRLRITVQLIQSSDGSHVWSETFDRDMTDIFEIQNEISTEVTQVLKITILKGTDTNSRANINSEAYDHFLRGRYYYETFAIENSTLKALEWFEKAIDKDSLFSLAWTYKSMCHWRLSPTATHENFKKAKAASIRAFELDPKSGIAAVNMAEILDTEYNFNEALKMIDLALKLEPNNPYILRNAGRFYSLIGRKKESIILCKKAVENDPIQRTALQYLIRALYFDKRYDEAYDLVIKFKELYPTILHIPEAISVIVSQSVDHDLIDQARANMTFDPSILYMDFLVAIRDEDIGSAKAHLKKLETTYPIFRYRIAKCYAVLGENDKAVDYLEDSFLQKDKSLTSIKAELKFESLRNEPRFQKIIKQMNFPD